MSSYNQRYIFEEPTSPSGIRLLFIHVPRKSLFALYLVFCVSFQQFLAPYVLVSVSFQRLLELPTFRRAANFISLGKYFSNTSVSVSQRILKVGPSLRPTVTYLEKTAIQASPRTPYLEPRSSKSPNPPTYTSIVTNKEIISSNRGIGNSISCFFAIDRWQSATHLLFASAIGCAHGPIPPLQQGCRKKYKGLIRPWSTRFQQRNMSGA